MKVKYGTLLVLSAGTAWGISSVSGQYLMSHGMAVNLLTSLRLLISGIVITFLAFLIQKEKFISLIKKKENILTLFIFSILGLLMNQLAFLSAIKFTNAGTATVLQYLSPVLILLYVSLTKKQLPTFAELLSILFAISGTLIMSTHGQITHMAMTPKGLFWGLLSAFTYSVYIILPAQLIKKWGSLSVIGLGMLIAGIIFPIITKSWQYHVSYDSKTILALFGIIGVGTVFAYTVFLMGTTIVGPVKGSLLACVEPIASVVFAIVIIKQHFYPIDFLGMTLILAAVLIISLRDKVINKEAVKIVRDDIEI